MADAILHRGCTMTCSLCASSIVVLAPTNRILKVGANEALVVGDGFVGNPCLGPNLQPPVGPVGPCTGVRWEGASTVLTANGSAVLLQTSRGHLQPEAPPRQVQIAAPPPTPLRACK